MMTTMTMMKSLEDDELDDDEHFLRERARCRLERLQMQQKKTRKRTPRRYQRIYTSSHITNTATSTQVQQKIHGSRSVVVSEGSELVG